MLRWVWFRVSELENKTAFASLSRQKSNGLEVQNGMSYLLSIEPYSSLALCVELETAGVVFVP